MVFYEGLKSVQLSQHRQQHFELFNFAWNKQHPLIVVQHTKTAVHKALLLLTNRPAFE